MINMEYLKVKVMVHGYIMVPCLNEALDIVGDAMRGVEVYGGDIVVSYNDACASEVI